MVERNLPSEKKVSSEQVITAIHLNLVVLLSTARAVRFIPLLYIIRMFGEDVLGLGQSASFIAIGIVAAEKDLNLATAADLVAEPALPLILDDLSLDAVHDTQRHE